MFTGQLDCRYHWVRRVLLFIGISTALMVAGVMAPAEAKTTISFWHVWSGERLPLVEKMIADFEALHPDIHIEHLLLTSQATMADRYMMAIAASAPPDVIMIHGGRHFPAFASKGLLYSLDSFLQAEKIDPHKTFIPAEYDTYVWNGHSYALPATTGGGSYIMYYDRDEFANAGINDQRGPNTWSEVEAYNKKLTLKRSDGSVERIGFSPAGFSNYPFKEWVFLNNGSLISNDGRKVLFNSPEGLEALRWMVESTDTIYPAVVNNYPIGSGSESHFQKGLVSMTVSGVWAVSGLATNTPNKNYGAWVMPYNDRNPQAKLRNIVEGTWGYAVPYNVKDPKAAWQFVKYATSEEGNHNFLKAQQRPSPVPRYNVDLFYYNAHPFWDVVLKVMEYGERSVIMPPQTEIDAVYTEMTSQVMKRTIAPGSAIESAAKKIQQILDDYWRSEAK